MATRSPRILVTGAGGLLGGAVRRAAEERGASVVPLTRDELDITNGPAVRAALRDAAPRVVFNCAAFSDVDRAEVHPAEAMAVNRDGARNVAEAAAAVGAVVVHISTDFVFDGEKRKPYLPTDPAVPLGHYGASKLAGERAVEEAGAEHLVVRTSWLFGEGGGGFVNAIRRALADETRTDPVRIVEDEVSRPTFIEDLAPALLDLVERGGRGCLHLANRGSCSRLELARAIRALLAEDPARGSAGGLRELEAISAEAFGAPAPRPHYSVLDLTAAEAVLGRRLPSWRDALGRYLRP